MKRPLSHRLLSLCLAALVLAASVGLTVQRHTCRISGRSKVSVGLPGAARALTGCAGELPTRVKSDCCDFSKHHHKLSAPAHDVVSAKVLPPPLLAAWLPALAWPRPANAAKLPGVAAERWFAADSSPPPLGGRALLTWACTLVV
ncbi:hypothetical protein Q5H93_18105 [Hymenobacter sp. ASUV-10]|uniref:Uncharacterized protein n=1 Tax=Hymenobacter aranciens TaxID=3063996 RepID=A0ABT9BEH4_9BACT|nr:hypothetical protein [Hymenobacter sp. ASUV-10]MDO7876665.1 hypothetical protein [Hymenobacter sp. ASUV-10]